MPKSSAVQFTLAAALVIATSASPVLAARATRSFQSLPSAFSHSAPQRSTGRFVQPPPVLSPSSGLDRSAAGSFTRDGGLRGRLNWKNPWRLAALFSRLPPQLQQIIADTLGDAGERGERLCILLGIPECQLPDSTG